MRMPVEMYDEIVERLTHRITKETTNWRAPLDPLRHFASGSKYKTMQYAWRVPHNTISMVVKEVCEAIAKEYLDKQLTCPTTNQN